MEIQAHWSLSLEPPSGTPRAFLRGESTSLAGCHGDCAAVVAVGIGDVCCPPTPSCALQTRARLLILLLPAARKTFDLERMYASSGTCKAHVGGDVRLLYLCPLGHAPMHGLTGKGLFCKASRIQERL